MGCVETITITINFTNLWALYAIHLKVSSLFWILINLDVICSPNNLFMTDTIVSSLLRWLYRILLYPRFICFLYLPWVFHTDTLSYLGGMILNPCSFSITSTWLSSLSYALSATTTDSGFILDILITIGLKSMLSCLLGARLTLMLQIICFRTSAPIDSLAYFFLFNLALLV